MSYKKKIFNNFTFKIIKIIIGIIISIIITRKFGADGKGYISYFILIIDMFATFSHIGINDATLYYYKKKDYLFDNLFNTGLNFVLIVSSFITLILVLVKVMKVGFNEYSLYFIILGSIYIIFKLIVIFLNVFYVADEKIIELNKYIFITDSIKLVTVIIFAFFNILTIEMYMIVMSGTQVILAILQISNLKISYKMKISWKLLVDELKYGIFIFAGSLSIFLNYRVDQFFIKEYYTNFEVGIYSVAVMFAELLFLVPVSVKTVLNGRLLNTKKIRGNNTVMISLKLTIYISCILALVGVVLSPLIPVIYGVDFKLSIKPTIILVVGTIFASIGTVLTSYVMSLGKNKLQMIFSVNTLVINIIMNYLLIPKFGITGAAVASMISYFVYGVQYLWFFIFNEKCSIRDVIMLKRNDLT